MAHTSFVTLRLPLQEEVGQVRPRGLEARADAR